MGFYAIGLSKDSCILYSFSLTLSCTVFWRKKGSYCRLRLCHAKTLTFGNISATIQDFKLGIWYMFTVKRATYVTRADSSKFFFLNYPPFSG